MDGRTPASWEVYSKALPKLNELADVGEVEVGTFSVEKVLALKPDLVVLADWQWQAIEDDLEPLEKAGIPVVVLDYNKEQLPLHLESTRVLGEITGQEARAKEIAAWYEGVVKDVHSRVEKSGQPKPKIYLEFGNKGPAEYGNSFGNTMWGPLAEQAMGSNIAVGHVEYAGPMNPEQVIVDKPEVVVISGRETELKKNEQALVMGINIAKDEALKRLNGYKTRQGWAELPAIKMAASTASIRAPRAHWPMPPPSSTSPRRSTPTPSRTLTRLLPTSTSTRSICLSPRKAPSS